MKAIKKVFPLAFILLAMACNQQKAEYALPEEDNLQYDMAQVSGNAMMTPPPPPPSPVQKTEKVNKKKIIKDGELNIQVRDLEQAKKRIDTLTQSYQGYYANESYNNRENEISYNLKIRIPADYFERFIADLEAGNGEVIYKEIEARNVTDQFIDLETRLKNKRNYLNRYNELLNKANSVADILQVQEKIRRLEEEIESTLGRLKYLNDQVDYSTLSMVLFQKKTFKYHPDQRDRFTERLKHALSGGWIGFINFLIIVIRLWPFWLILTGVIYLWRRIRKKKKNQKK